MSTNSPIILDIEPVKEHSEWKPAGAPADSKADVVNRLLERAQQYVDLDEILLDRGFYSPDVHIEIHSRGLLYTTPVSKYEDDSEAIQQIESNDGDAAVRQVLVGCGKNLTSYRSRRSSVVTSAVPLRHRFRSDQSVPDSSLPGE